MFDYSLCQQVSPTRAWTLVSTTLLVIFSRPLLAIAILFIVASLPWLLGKKRWQKRVTIVGAALAAVYLIGISPVASSVGGRLLMAAVPPDSGEKADAIVVLGRGEKQNAVRSRIAGELWQAKRAPFIFPSGRKDALLMSQLIRQQFPEAVVKGEPCSLTTDQNAEFTAALLRPEAVETIILVTDPPHMWRSLLTFESFGFKVIPHVSPLSAGTNLTKERFLVVRESIGLLNYGILGRYRARKVPPPSIISDDS